MRRINEIIVHCAATPAGKAFYAADIERWHRQRGFDGIGYHFIVDLDGAVEAGRGIETPGAHCLGHNSHSIGVCYIGGCASDGKTPCDTRTGAQKESLIRLLRELKLRFPAAVIRSHRDFAAKACPSFDATAEYNEL